MKPFHEYLDCVDKLRRQRAEPFWLPEHDREILARCDDLYHELEDDEREVVELSSWRVWPDLFKKQPLSTIVGYLNTSSRWRREECRSGATAWYHLGGNAIVVFLDELEKDSDVARRIMEIEA